MGRQIIKQPNGKFCIFSSIVDNVVAYDCTKEEIIEESVRHSGEISRSRVEQVFEKLEVGEKPYYQFTMTYEEMLEEIKDQHGQEEMQKIKKLIEE
jgi:hypothetical protein